MNKSLELTISQAGLKVSHCVLGREVSSMVVQVQGKIQDAADITGMLDAFHKKSVCRGGPGREKFPGLQLKCASVDKTGFWRHKRCPLLLYAAEAQCVSCRGLYNTLYVHEARKKKTRPTGKISRETEISGIAKPAHCLLPFAEKTAEKGGSSGG